MHHVPSLIHRTSRVQVKEAVADAERATQLAPKWPKGWFRLAAARTSAGDLPGTVAAYTRSLALVRSLDDAQSSPGDAKSFLGDAKRSLGDATRSLGDTKRSLGGA